MLKCFFIHEKEANSILTKSGLKHLVAVTPSIQFWSVHGIMNRSRYLAKLTRSPLGLETRFVHDFMNRPKLNLFLK